MGDAMHELGRMLLGIGLLIALIGAAILLASRIGLPMGRLPGDISYKGKNVSFYFPIGTSIPDQHCPLADPVLFLALPPVTDCRVLL